MLQIIIKIISILMVLAGVVMIYDARKLTKKWFGFNDQNEGSKWFKIGGFVLSIIGIIIILFEC